MSYRQVSKTVRTAVNTSLAAEAQLVYQACNDAAGVPFPSLFQSAKNKAVPFGFPFEVPTSHAAGGVEGASVNPMKQMVMPPVWAVQGH